MSSSTAQRKGGTLDRLAALSPGQRLMASAKARVLDHLDANGPSYVAEVPRSWPVTAPFIRRAVSDLVAEGQVRWVGFRAPRRITLTVAALRDRCR
jgi:hypothetical protein